MAHTVRAFTIATLLAVPFVACRRDTGASPSDIAAVGYEDLSGARHTLAEHAGKVVLVDVWATWCPPCRQSLPEVAALQKAGGADYVVLPISVDKEGWKAVKPFLEANPGLGLEPVLPAAPGALKAFGSINAIPTTLVIGKDGRVADRWVGFRPGRAEQAIKAALSKP